MHSTLLLVFIAFCSSNQVHLSFAFNGFWNWFFLWCFIHHLSLRSHSYGGISSYQFIPVPLRSHDLGVESLSSRDCEVCFSSMIRKLVNYFTHSVYSVFTQCQNYLQKIQKKTHHFWWEFPENCIDTCFLPSDQRTARINIRIIVTITSFF